MEREFTASTGMKIFYATIATFMAGFALYLFNLDHSKAPVWIIVIPIFILIFAATIIINLFRNKIIISADQIVRVGILSTYEMPTSDVRGYRIREKTISIEPCSSANPKITINNYVDLAESENLVDWLKENFQDLDNIDIQAEKVKVLKDTKLGLTQDERESKLSIAKKAALVYNVIGCVVGFWMMFLKNDIIAAVVMLSFPLLGIMIIIFSNGLIKFVSDSKRSVYPFVVLGFVITIFVMLLKSIRDYEILQYDHLLLPFMIIGSAVFLTLYKAGLNISIPIKSQIFTMLVVSLMYGFGATIQVNCVFDKSAPQSINTSIKSKSIEYNKGSHYYLKLRSWDSNPNSKDIEVSKSIYEKYNQGDNIGIALKPGMLNIPWYYLSVS
jgi:hypothetical protein